MSCIIMILNQQQQNYTLRRKSKVIGNYQLGRVIGTGTFATVRQAIHLPTKQKVSIKILNKKLIIDARDKINVSREVRILKQIRHPSIAQLFEVIETNSKIYLVIEKVDAGQLYAQIVNQKKGRLEEKIACSYFQQLLSVIEYLHSLGISHRDIKPQNILLTSKDSIKLIDFGLSNFFQLGETLSTACGSPCYAAPEMLAQTSYDPKLTDLWSCGVVLYTMLCGYLPFQHQNNSQLYKIMVRSEYQEPSYLSLDSKDLLKKMLRVLPIQRLTIHQIRQHPFCRQKEIISRGLLPNQKIILEETVMQKMKILGCEGFVKDIQEHHNTSNTATYYLLLFRKIQQEGHTLAEYYSKFITQNRKKIGPNHSTGKLLQAFQRNSLKGHESMMNLIKLANPEDIKYFQRLKQKSLEKVIKSEKLRIRSIRSILKFH